MSHFERESVSYKPQVFMEAVRPQRISDMWNYESCKPLRTLEFQMMTGGLANLFIISGGYGTGKTTTARAMGKWKACRTDRDKSDVACGKCVQCLKIASGWATAPGPFSPTAYAYEEFNAAMYFTGKTILERMQYDSQIIPDEPFPPDGRFQNKHAQPALFVVDEAHLLPKADQEKLASLVETYPLCVVSIALVTTDVEDLSDRLRSRAGGGSYHLTPPTRKEAIAGMQKIANQLKVEVDDRVLGQIADMFRVDPRETKTADNAGDGVSPRECCRQLASYLHELEVKKLRAI